MSGPTVLDLFCGCGGISWGLQKGGFNVVAGIDEWEPALTTFQQNHPQAGTFHGDIRDLPAKQVRDALGLGVVGNLI